MKKVFVTIIALVLLGVIAFSSFSTLSGFATNNESAVINVEIVRVLEITLMNGTVNFGSCAINLSQGYLFLDSSLNETGANNSACSNGLFPSELVIRNTGTLDANVTVSVAKNGSEFFNDSDSWLAYRSYNGSFGGCSSGLQVNYTNFSLNNFSYPVCANLSFLSTKDVSVPIQAYINASATGAGTFLMYFSANVAS